MRPHVRLLLALVLGITLGTLLSTSADAPLLAGLNAYVLRPIGQLFLRLLFMIVVPMVFSALVIGVFELGRGRDLAGVMARTLGFTVALSATSALIGLTLVNVVQPGRAVALDLPASSAGVQTIQSNAAAARSWTDTLIGMVPRNPVESAARAFDGELLPLMVFALIFGVALSRSRDAAGGVVVPLLNQVFEACLRIVEAVMKAAPLAVFAIVFGTTLTFGVAVLRPLVLFVLVVVGGLALQQFGVYALALRLVAGRSPVAFFRHCRDVFLYAFSTASSNATLPLSLDVAERRLKLPPSISRFVLTVGATANQNGTALFEGVTVMFLAQAYGLHLSLSQQAQVMLMAVLGGIGTAGVPGGSLPMVLIVAQSVGVPAEGMALILGVDRLLDMCRTVVNVSGDLVISTLVAGRRDAPVASGDAA